MRNRGTYMKSKLDNTTLGKLAQELRSILGQKSSEDQLLSELDRFVNHYGLRIEEAWRAVMVLHGIPPGLTGPTDRRFSWQPELDAFVGT
jgi:hypothetical protein